MKLPEARQRSEELPRQLGQPVDAQVQPGQVRQIIEHPGRQLRDTVVLKMQPVQVRQSVRTPRGAVRRCDWRSAAADSSFDSS